MIHRDLAARNILVDRHWRARVADFGFARVKAASASRGFTSTELGPIKWEAPEAMRERAFCEASDVFSFGVVLYEMHARRPPWAGCSNVDVVCRVCAGERMEVRGVGAFDGDAPLAELVGACWEHDAARRPAMADVAAALERRCADDEALVEPEPMRSGAPGASAEQHAYYAFPVGAEVPSAVAPAAVAS